MKRSQTQTMAFMALYVALYIVLKYVGNFIPILNMPNGGSIALELIALFIASYHLGWFHGLMVALLCWLISFIMGMKMYLLYPIQILLDYMIPLGACGCAALFWPWKSTNKKEALFISALLFVGCFVGIWLSFGNSIVVYVIGIVIAMIIYYISTVLSGAYYWADGVAAGSLPAWTFSLQYNLGYNLVTMIVCCIAVPFIVRALKKSGIVFNQ